MQPRDMRALKVAFVIGVAITGLIFFSAPSIERGLLLLTILGLGASLYRAPSSTIHEPISNSGIPSTAQKTKITAANWAVIFVASVVVPLLAVSFMAPKEPFAKYVLFGVFSFLGLVFSIVSILVLRFSKAHDRRKT